MNSVIVVVLSFLLNLSATAVSTAPQARQRQAKTATSLSRRLEDEEEESFLMEASLQFDKCRTVETYDEERGTNVREHFVTFRFCNLVNADNSNSDVCDTTCSSDFGEYVVRLEDYLQHVVEYRQAQRELKCEICEQECIGAALEAEQDEDETDCDICFGACELIENFEDNGYIDATEFIECQMIFDGEDEGDELFAGPICTSEGTAIRVGVFLDEECKVQDDSKSVEDFLMDEDGFSFKLSYQLLKQVYDSDEAECIVCQEREEDAAPMIKPVCQKVLDAAATCETDEDGRDEASCELIASVFSSRGGKLIELPPGVQIEGVTHARGSNFIGGDVRGGAMYLVDIDSGLITTAVPPSRGSKRSAVGSFVQGNRLFVAGGGRALGVRSMLHIYDLVRGTLLASCGVPSGFVNDVHGTTEYAHFTDSFRGLLHRLDLAALPECRVETTRLPRPTFGSEKLVFRANGIVAWLVGHLMGNSKEGSIFFVHGSNNSVKQLVPSGTIPFPDGMDIDYKRNLLYVCQNALRVISVWRIVLDEDEENGGRYPSPSSLEFVRNITSPLLDYPTTVSVVGDKLVAANGRFDTASPFEPLADESTVFSLAVLDL